MKFRDISINALEKVPGTNSIAGWVVRVGCKTMVYTDPEAMAGDLLAYCRDPKLMEARATENDRPTCDPRRVVPPSMMSQQYSPAGLGPAQQYSPAGLGPAQQPKLDNVVLCEAERPE